MSDVTRPPIPAAGPADGELLAAYLAGELDDAAADDLEARLGREPALARRLELLATALTELAGAPEPPAGFEERLTARLAAERGAQGADLGGTRAGGREAKVVDLSSRRRGSPWLALGTAAAALAVLVVGGVQRTSRLSGGEVAGEAASSAVTDEATEEATSAELRTVDELAGQGGSAGGDVADTSIAADAPVEEAQAPSLSVPAARDQPTEPRIDDDEVALDDETAVRAYAAEDQAATQLLGLPPDRAQEVSAAFRTVVERAPAFRNGLAPAACIDAITASVNGPVVVTRVASATEDGEPRALYVLVSADDPSAPLNRVEAWLVDTSCATRLFLSL